MKIKEIWCKRWFLKRNIGAITLYPYVFYNKNHGTFRSSDKLEVVRRHEAIHVTQIRKMMDRYWKWLRFVGWLQWYGTYILKAVWSLFSGKGIDYEHQAYERQDRSKINMDDLV